MLTVVNVVVTNNKKDRRLVRPINPLQTFASFYHVYKDYPRQCGEICLICLDELFLTISARNLLLRCATKSYAGLLRGNSYLYIITIRRSVNGISRDWTDNIGRSAPLGNYDLAILHRQFERPLWVPPILRLCYNLFWFHVAPTSRFFLL